MRSARVVATGRTAVLAIVVFLAGALSATAVRGTDLGFGVQGDAKQGPTLKFDSDVGLIFNLIKADQAGPYEASIAKLKEAFAKIDNPDRKQQAGSWAMYKAAEPGPNSTVMYISVIQPPVKDAEYNIFKIIAEVFPTEATELYKTATPGFAGTAQYTLRKVADFR